MPARFHPRDGKGLPMRGPSTVREGGTGMPHNWGRQYFRSSTQDGGMVWADGTVPFGCVSPWVGVAERGPKFSERGGGLHEDQSINYI